MGDERSAYTIRNSYPQTWHTYLKSRKPDVAAMLTEEKVDVEIGGMESRRRKGQPFLLTDNKLITR